MPVNQPDYPNIVCDAHPGLVEPGYVKCEHVNKPDEVFYLEVATPQSLGVISCLRCINKGQDQEYVLKHFVTCCAQGLRELGYLLEVN